MYSKKYMLAYGMNTNLNSMRWRCPQARSLGKVTLKDHKLAFRTFCDAVNKPGATMERSEEHTSELQSH